MKSKKFSKKLSLNKKTIARLNNNVMDNVYGGYWTKLFVTECIGCNTIHQTNCNSKPCCVQENGGVID
jgi:hypothetical protein